MTVKTSDKAAYIATKEACVARSGVYTYSYEEMLSRGITPSVKKDFYTEYRPPEVLKRSIDKFGLAPVTVEHTSEFTGPDNFRKQAVGVVGDKLILKDMPDGKEVGIYGKMAFYTKDGFDYYQMGGRETSADYVSSVEPDPTGRYDFVLKDINSINSIALTSRGRGGKDVRVLDSGKNIYGRRNTMSVLNFLTGKKDEGSTALSKRVFDSARTLHNLDQAGKEKVIGEIVGEIMGLPESKQRDLLLSSVKDSLANPTEAVKVEEKMSKVIDGLHAACRATDEETEKLLGSFLQTKDSDEKDEKASGKDEADCEKEKDAKGAKGGTCSCKDSLDVESIVTKAVEKSIERVTDSISGIVDKKVKELLGVEAKADGKKDERSLDSFDDGGFGIDANEIRSYFENN